LDGTIEKESIQSSAGADSRDGMKLHEFVSLIKNSGLLSLLKGIVYIMS